MPRLSIRRGTFETNSSSVHAIVIDKTKDYDDSPESITRLFGDFYGQETRVLRTSEERLSYLWSAVLCLEEDVNWWYYHIVDTLGLPDDIPFDTRELIRSEYDDFMLNETPWTRDDYYEALSSLRIDCGIDHQENIVAFVGRMRNPKLLRQFVYGDSVVICATESDIEEVSKPYGIDWDTIDEDVLYGYGENDSRKGYLYVKGE